ncbi:MAG: hypothetical protein ACKOJC_09105, partial [Actinomycetota bacterium]
MGMIGERVVRTEDPALVTGHGTFIDNLVLDGALHVVYVRSTMAHARITSIDSESARSMPGVHAVLTHAEKSTSRPAGRSTTTLLPCSGKRRVDDVSASSGST